MEPIDKKFRFMAAHPCKAGVIYTEEDGFIMLAKDDAVLETLRFYMNECERRGAEQNQLDAINQMWQRVNIWRTANPDKCKVADVEGPCEIKQVLGDG